MTNRTVSTEDIRRIRHSCVVPEREGGLALCFAAVSYSRLTPPPRGPSSLRPTCLLRQRSLRRFALDLIS